MYGKEEAKALRVDFWETLNKKAATIRRREGRPKKFMLEKTGIKPVRLKFHTNKNDVAVSVIIQSKHESIRLRYYEKFYSLKEIMESEIENLEWELIYEDEYKSEMSRISTTLSDVNYFNKEDWDKIFAFFIGNMNKFEDIIEEYREYLKSRINE